MGGMSVSQYIWHLNSTMFKSKNICHMLLLAWWKSSKTMQANLQKVELAL
jgi:hypothetical protein